MTVGRPCLVLCALLVAGSAAAAPRKVFVFPLDGAMANDPGNGLKKLTRVLSRAAGLTGSQVTVGKASYDDTAVLAGCSGKDVACFAKVAATLKVDDVVVGTVEPNRDGGAKVSLALYKEGKVHEHVVTLPDGEMEKKVEAMARRAAPLFVGSEPTSEEKPEETSLQPVGDEEPAAQAPERPAEATPVAPPPEEPDEERGFSRVGAGSWILAAAGVVLVGGGVAALVMARSKQDEVDRSATDTSADFARLRDLEEEGERLTLAANGLLIGGGVVAAVGISFVLYQGLSGGDAGETRVSLVPLPLRGGAGLGFQVTMP
jgi:hypothetical protein